MYKKIGISSVAIALLLIFLFKGIDSNMKKSLITVNSLDDVVTMFNHDAGSIAEYKEYVLEDARKQMAAITSIPAEQRTWFNTPDAYNRLGATSDLIIFMTVIYFLNITSPDPSVREAASKALAELQEFLVDLQMNQDIYRSFVEYIEGPMKSEDLSDTQKYFITEVIKEFKRSGLDKSQDQQEKIKACQKKIGDLCLQVSQNNAQDQSSISVHPDDLTGLDQDFINALKKDGEHVVLGVDYPTYFKVMEQCTNGAVRKKLYFAFNNRSYPANEKLLHEIIALRDELAKLLSFKSYADYELEDEMVQSVDRAERFLADVLDRANKKEAFEFVLMRKHLPEGVELNEDGILNPWDVQFIQESYKKSKYNLDKEKMAEYFPMEKTISGLLSIYEQFFGLTFKQVPVSGLWSDEVRALEVIDKESNRKMGYLLLDLHPRPFKYSHACEGDFVPATIHDGKPTTSVCLVIANFPKPTAEKPSLLKPDDVRTFFHEFGHALHDILGGQEIASMAGANVKRDFVEMPSQMLEEWLWDKEILKMISGHYETGEPLPDEMIDTMIAVKNLFEGDFLQRQISFSILSLDCFKEGAEKNLKELSKKAQMRCRPHIAYQPDTHKYCSFGHLTGYGARYYGYLWSKVFALDLFNEIKKHGLLNASIGKKYRDLVIGKGGSKDPNELLRDFLGREPNSDAFFSDLGI